MLVLQVAPLAAQPVPAPAGWTTAPTPPAFLNEAESKQREPSKWHHWKSAGNDILVATDGQWKKLDADRVRPLPPGAAMSIALIHRHSTGFGGMGSFNTMQTISLQPNGRYKRSAGAIAGTGAVQAAGGYSVYIDGVTYNREKH